MPRTSKTRPSGATKSAKAKKVRAKKTQAKKAAAKKSQARKAAAKKTQAKKTQAKKAPAKTGSGPTAERLGRRHGVPRPPEPALRVLVVDDEPEIRELVTPFLEALGHTVDEAADGDEALEAILTVRPNLVLLDVMMPGLNGWEICRYVRERRELDGVRIIMATGIGEETNAATSPLYGADTYLDKPFDLRDLERAVADVTRRFELEKID